MYTSIWCRWPVQHACNWGYIACIHMPVAHWMCWYTSSSCGRGVCMLWYVLVLLSALHCGLHTLVNLCMISSQLIHAVCPSNALSAQVPFIYVSLLCAMHAGKPTIQWQLHSTFEGLNQSITVWHVLRKTHETSVWLFSFYKLCSTSFIIYIILFNLHYE